MDIYKVPQSDLESSEKKEPFVAAIPLILLIGFVPLKVSTGLIIIMPGLYLGFGFLAFYLIFKTYLKKVLVARPIKACLVVSGGMIFSCVFSSIVTYLTQKNEIRDYSSLDVNLYIAESMYLIAPMFVFILLYSKFRNVGK